MTHNLSSTSYKIMGGPGSGKAGKTAWSKGAPEASFQCHLRRHLLSLLAILPISRLSFSNLFRHRVYCLSHRRRISPQ